MALYLASCWAVCYARLNVAAKSGFNIPSTDLRHIERFAAYYVKADLGWPLFTSLSRWSHTASMEASPWLSVFYQLFFYLNMISLALAVCLRSLWYWKIKPFPINSIQFYSYTAFNKGAFSQSCFTENQPPMSKPRATVARKNSLADNRKKPWAEPDSEGNHLPLVGTGFNPMNLVHLDSSHVGMRWQVTVAGRGCPAGLGWISGPGGAGLRTWARAPGRCSDTRCLESDTFLREWQDGTLLLTYWILLPLSNSSSHMEQWVLAALVGLHFCQWCWEYCPNLWDHECWKVHTCFN